MKWIKYLIWRNKKDRPKNWLEEQIELAKKEREEYPGWLKYEIKRTNKDSENKKGG